MENLAEDICSFVPTHVCGLVTLLGTAAPVFLTVELQSKPGLFWVMSSHTVWLYSFLLFVSSCLHPYNMCVWFFVDFGMHYRKAEHVDIYYHLSSQQFTLFHHLLPAIPTSSPNKAIQKKVRLLTYMSSRNKTVTMHALTICSEYSLTLCTCTCTHIHRHTAFLLSFHVDHKINLLSSISSEEDSPSSPSVEP